MDETPEHNEIPVGHPLESSTFIVRVWRETKPNGRLYWSGRIERVGDLEVAYLHGLDDISGFIEKSLLTTSDSKETLSTDICLDEACHEKKSFD